MLGSLFIVFVRVGRVIYAQTMVQCAAFGCNNKSSNPDVERSDRVHSFHSFPIKRPPLLKKWLTKLDWNSSVCPGSGAAKVDFSPESCILLRKHDTLHKCSLVPIDH